MSPLDIVGRKRDFVCDRSSCVAARLSSTQENTSDTTCPQQTLLLRERASTPPARAGRLARGYLAIRAGRFVGLIVRLFDAPQETDPPLLCNTEFS